MSLNTVKFNPPEVMVNAVERSSLVKRLLSEPQVKLVIVHAPAGFGKTTLLSQYFHALRQQGEKVSWLSLDPNDNDWASFINQLKETLEYVRNSNTTSSAKTPTLKDDRKNNSKDMWDWMITAFSDQHMPDYHFFDEFEVITESTILELVAAGLHRMPKNRQIVIGSRTLPEFSFSRLQINDEVRIIGADELRFNVEECHNLYSSNNILDLSDQKMASIIHQTEGWPTALQTVLILLKNNPENSEEIIKRVTSNKLFSDYILENILKQLTKETQQFLLKTSIITDLTPDICNHITETKTANTVLESILKNGLFTQRSGNSENYRYHKLFAKTLYQYQAKSNPTETQELHKKAADWYTNNNNPIEAIDHLLKANDIEGASQIMDEHALDFIYRSQLSVPLLWASTLPKSTLNNSHKLQLACAWANSLSRNYETSNDILKKLEKLKKTENIDKGIIYRIPSLKITNLIMADNFENVENSIQKYLKIIPTDAIFERLGLNNCLSFVLLSNNKFESARCLIMATQGAACTPESQYTLAYSYGILAMEHIILGQLRQAKQTLKASSSIINDFHFEDAKSKAIPIPGMAELLYEENKTEDALTLLEQTLPIIRSQLPPDWLITSFITLARIYALNKQSHLTFKTLDDLERIGYSEHLPRLIATARWEMVRQYQLQGDISRAEEISHTIIGEQLSSRLPDRRFHPADIEADDISLIRLYLGQGEIEKARTLHTTATDGTHPQRFYRHLKLSIQSSLIYQAEKDPKQAISTLLSAIDCIGDEPYIRSFIDEGMPLINLLKQLHSHLSTKVTTVKHEKALAKINELLTAAGDQAIIQKPEQKQELIEPLTKRERELLQSIADGHSNKDIANMLHLTESTVKWHLGNIYSKMGVKKRTQAIANGRQLGLID